MSDAVGLSRKGLPRANATHLQDDTGAVTAAFRTAGSEGDYLQRGDGERDVAGVAPELVSRRCQLLQLPPGGSGNV
jgi:hypothetical protein